MRTVQRPGSRRPAVVAPVLTTLTAALLVLIAPPAAAQDAVDASVALDGRDVDTLDINDPLVLQADEPVEVALDVTNPSAESVTVRSVRLRSNVIGLTFLAYETRIDLEVPADGSNDVIFDLDLLDLRSQATGLLPAEVELLDAERDILVARDLTVDVQGSFTSVYGTFGVVILVVTLVGLGLGLFRLATGRLPANRWSRGLQFAAPGLGLGLVAAIGLSTLRIFSPRPGLWGTLLVGGTVIGFVLGYLTPTPSREEVVDLEDIEVVRDDASGDRANGDAASRDAAGDGEGPADPGRQRSTAEGSRSTIAGQRPQDPTS